MKKKVTYYSPGTFVAEMTQREIRGKDKEEIIRNATIEGQKIIERYNATPYGFRIEGESITYYLPHTRIELLKEIKDRNDPKDRILISNMECNNWNAVVVTTEGWKTTQPLDEEDCIVDAFGNIILRGFEADINIVRERKLERILKNAD
ncbi:MAG: hypothetical protein M0R46_11645 [Candidatus Muirbacterium halophilum]|nr:hypothetical protein [Candidatus Muirbacterium halophilum]